MKRGVGHYRALLAALPWAALLAGTLQVAGCASTGVEPQRQETVSLADEGEARRRARIRMELAVGYFEQGQTAVALDELKQVVQADPSYPDAYNLRGLIYMRMNDLPQAEESFRRAVALDPRDGNTLHNLGWLQCQTRRYDEAQRTFEQALEIPTYGSRSKTMMAQGLCQSRAGKPAEAEATLKRAYELDAGNPIIGYNLADLLYARGELPRAQFYIRRLNNSQLANAETLWLGIKVERKLGEQLAMNQLADQLKKRYPQSRQAALLDRGAFDE
ncbi:MAG TPA: type IV pilus biogenesis/stability protein PilW [Ramlibacter sp.]|jgi:type IV pilus assembly protein PilF|uniref:type IV pilus biogenesis/stability protein PilW n=1 Tax=Ramlibacter sp. TaxID=1917967 RepID=UPI002D2B716A|nr:type IV pilus biogenesis/stability protein PilW [Ramlibacter sp.]HZY18664.1 type IV pilus biogenesis/stability protein PilW [Ramlibacter sp.]